MPSKVLLLHYLAVAMFTLGYGSFQSFVPVFAVNLGASYGDLGFIGAVTAIPYIIMPIIIGFIADRLNRVNLYLVSVLFNVATTAQLYFAGSVIDVLVARALGGVAYAVYWPVVEVIISDLTEPHERMKAFGEYSVSFALGFGLGPFIGGVMSDMFGVRNIFIFSSVMMILSLVWAAFTLKRRYSGAIGEKRGFKLSMAPFRQLAPIYIISILGSTVFSTGIAILPGYLKNVGISAYEIGGVYALLGFYRMLAYHQAYRFGRLGELRALAGSSLLMTVSLLAISIGSGAASFAVIMIPFGISTALFFPLTLAPASRPFPKEKQGLAIGLYESISGVGWVIGPAMTGILSDAYSPGFAFVILAAVSILTIPVLLIHRTGKLRQPSSG